MGDIGSHALALLIGFRQVGAHLVESVGELAQLKLAAIRRHVSQTGSVGPFHDWSPEMRDAYLATEHYRLVRSNLPVPAGGGEQTSTESSLWDGLV